MKIITMFTASLCFILLSLTVVKAGEGTSGAAAPHRLLKLDSLISLYKPVLFNHEKHVAIAGDCGKCHHQHGNNTSLPCHECHSIKAKSFKGSVTASFMACKNCHGAYDPATPQMPGLKVAYHRQCFQCHWGMNDVGLNPKGCTVMCHAKRDQKASAKANKAL
jgi:hypothetical protein